MNISRRMLLGAAASGALFSQAREPLTVSQPRSGLRLEQHGNPQRPTIALFLPEINYPSVVIEMPEHCLAKREGGR